MSIKVLVSYIHLSIKKLIPLEYSHTPQPHAKKTMFNLENFV